MPKSVNVDTRIYIAGIDFSGDANAHGIGRSRAAVEKTAYLDDWDTFMPGLKSFAYSFAGLWNDAPEAALHDSLDQSDEPMILAPSLSDDGNTCFLAKILEGEYTVDAPIGAAFTFSVSGTLNDLVSRATIMANETKGSSGDGVARQLGAVSDEQSVYAVLQVLAASGSSPTLDVVIESDDNSGMTTPVQRLAFTQAIGVGAEWVELSGALGAITDDWWRATFTIAGGTPSFDVIVGVGIKQFLT